MGTPSAVHYIVNYSIVLHSRCPPPPAVDEANELFERAIRLGAGDGPDLAGVSTATIAFFSCVV